MPSATATHVIDAVERRVAAAVAVAGGGAALATVLLRLVLWQPLNITQALCVGLAVAASLTASMLLAGPVAFASREPARRAAFSMLGRAAAGGAAGAIIGRGIAGELLGGAVAGLSDAVARGCMTLGARPDRRMVSDVLLASFIAALRSACGASLIARAYGDEARYVELWLRSALSALATHLLCDVSRRWLAYACRQSLDVRTIAERVPDRRFQPKTEWSVALAVEASELGDPITAKTKRSSTTKKRSGFVARSSADPFAAASSQTQPWRLRIEARQKALQAAVTQAFAKETSVDFRSAWLAPPSPLDVASGGLILGDAALDASHRLAKWLSLRALGDGLLDEADDSARDRALDVALLVLDGLTVRVDLATNHVERDALGTVREDTLACAIRKGRATPKDRSSLPAWLLDLLDPRPQPRIGGLHVSAAECAACAAAARIVATCPAFKKDGASRAAAALNSLAGAQRALGGVPPSPDRDALMLDVAHATDSLCAAFRADLSRFAFSPEYASTLRRHADAAAAYNYN